ncbi:hypothetical protein Hdeb2414_s0005g00161121 [Helianthus debilis subsp. tardiflorus]
MKEEKKKKSRKANPKFQMVEGSSSQPKRKRQKKTVETMLVDEPEEDEAEAEIEADTEAAGDVEGNDGDKSSSSSSDEKIDENERAKRIQAEIEKEKQLKRKRRQEKEDDVYVPSPKHVTDSQTHPSSGERKKISARKSVASTKAARKNLILRLPKRTPKSKQPTPPPSPPPKPSPPKSPQKSPPKQPSSPQLPHQSPLHLSPLHLSPPHVSPPNQIPIQEQPILTSQQIFQTPPSLQPYVQSTPGSSGYKAFPNIPDGISLEEIKDFNFASDDHVKNVEKKTEAVVVENKRLVDREKILEMRVKKVESENKSLLKKIETDQTEIDILKVKVAKAMKEHEIYMMNKVLENMLGKSVEQRFEEIEVEEVRAKHQAEIDNETKNKGKGVEGVLEVSKRSIVPSTILDSPI